MTKLTTSSALAVAVGQLSAVLACLLAAEIPAQWEIDNVRRTEPAAGAERFEVHNLHGDLRLRPTDREEIFLSAMRQRHVDDPLRAEIDVTRDGSTCRIGVRYRSVKDLDASDPPDSWRRRRVDVTLFVPAGRPIVVETDEGLIEVKGFDHGIVARSEVGDIVLWTAGHVSARTERGSISVRFSNTDWSAPVELETRTGSITAALPAEADASVTLRTSGQLTTDYSMTIERAPGSRQKTGHATLGTGRSKLSLTSARGNLTLISGSS